MKFILAVTLVLLSGCSRRYRTELDIVANPALFPKNTVYRDCWTSQERGWIECRYTVEGRREYQFLRLRARVK